MIKKSDRYFTLATVEFTSKGVVSVAGAGSWTTLEDC